MKKVLFTASTYSHIRNFHLPYLCEFQQGGWQVHVGCAGVPEEIPCADGVWELPFEKSMSAPANFKAARMLRRLVRQEGYDLVCSHTSLAAFFTRLALLGLKERPHVINMVHGYLFDDETPWMKRQVLLAAERLTAPCTDLLLTMNQWDFEAAKKYGLGDQVAHVPGVGVDFSRFAQNDPELSLVRRREFGIPDDAFVLFYAAEFSARKSQRVLIEAMTQLPEKTVLVLAGQGTLLEECKALAQKLGAAERVIFPGYVADVGVWYGAADAAVTSSRSEGLPFNVMEAMYCNLPVVASAVKGHTDLIEDGQTGLLYPYGDVAACAAQIGRLMEDAALRSELTRNAKESVAAYGLDSVLPVVMNQYRSAVQTEAVI